MKPLDYYISNDLSSKQYLDETCNLYFPWFTKPFLDVLKTWDLSKANIFEFGSGHSTLWFASKCKSLISIEHDPDFYFVVRREVDKLKFKNIEYNFYPMEHTYINFINKNDKKYDCIIIDGAWRNECGLEAISHLKSGSILILDNANQKSCGEDNTPIFKALENSEHFSFLHPWHIHGDWRTDYWKIS
jgi:predicted O-methyltransferase YrrM